MHTWLSRTPARVAGLVFMAAAFPSAASAQPWQGRFLIGANAVAQTTSSTLGDSFTYTHPYTANIPGEEASVETTYKLPQPMMPDLGVLVRIVGNFAAGIVYDQSSATSDLKIAARIPHPLLIAHQRRVEGTLQARHEESGIHLNAAYVVPVTGKLYFALSGGPSYFRVKQRAVKTVSVTEAYPYDTATFLGADVEVLKESGWGFNAGVDLGWMFNRTFGAGGLLRYTRGTIRVKPAGRAALDIDAGGLHAGVGARLAF